MSETREFDLSDVLTVTTGKLLGGMAGLYAILGYMTGDDVYTHQIPRVMRECQPHLLRQFPALAAVDGSTVTTENVHAWMAELRTRLPNTFAVAPIPRDDHSFRDPVAELESMVGKSRVIVVEP